MKLKAGVRKSVGFFVGSGLVSCFPEDYYSVSYALNFAYSLES